jgi:carotenoid cleavage dioxygenase-like enzyme
MTTETTNRYLVGNFAPVTHELTVTDLPVQGAIPPALNGRLLRNGPNPIAPDPAHHHRCHGAGGVRFRRRLRACNQGFPAEHHAAAARASDQCG